MIVTLTPNPSLDRTLEIDGFRRGGVVRANRFWLDPGGKGVNVSRVLSLAGVDTIAVFPCGPKDSDFLELLDSYGVFAHVVPISGRIRQNISVLEPEGVITHINEPGPTLSEDEAHRILAAVEAEMKHAEWVCASGTLAPGLAPDLYAQVSKLARKEGARVAVDTSSEYLELAIENGVDLIKPNRHELEEAVGGGVSTLGDAIEAARILQNRGAERVLASLGGDGAILIQGNDVFHCEADAGPVVSTVGAGDALLAGFLAGGANGPDALSNGVAWAGAKVLLPGSTMPEAAKVRTVKVKLMTKPNVMRKLREG